MSSDVRAAIPKPTICRKVVVSRLDGKPFAIGLPPGAETPILVREAPADVVRVATEGDLGLTVIVAHEVFEGVPHADLVSEHHLPRELVWRWPPRA